MFLYDRLPVKKRLVFPGKPALTKKSKKKVPAKLEKLPKDEKSSEAATPPEHQDATDELESERTVRKSSRTSVILRQAERDAIRAALQATMKVCFSFDHICLHWILQFLSLVGRENNVENKCMCHIQVMMIYTVLHKAILWPCCA